MNDTGGLENGTEYDVCGFEDILRDDDAVFLKDYVEHIGYPVLLFCCTMGNVVSLLLLLTEKAKTSNTVYLICMAAGDLGVL